MAQYLKELYNELVVIRKYLIKIGPTRRQGSIAEKKLNESKAIVKQYNTYVENISRIGRSKEEEEYILEICEKISKLYEEIILITEKDKEICEKMEFDLKVALNLLPVMSDDVSNTKQLIDGIEYYRSVIATEQHCNLISFILKTRLSQGAKLKLASKYDSIELLLSDMRKSLLPLKSACILQKQMLNIKQQDLSIDDFGKKLSEMFVDLTIAQSEGDSVKYDVLKSINEKQAIRQFCDGLRNRRISTIISAQKFESLKDAVQAATEENTSTMSASGEILSIKRNNYNTPIFRKAPPLYGNPGNSRGRRTTSTGFQGCSRGPRGYPPSSRGGWPRAESASRARPAFTSYMRGKSFTNNYRTNRSSPRQIRVASEQHQDQQPTTSSDKGFSMENEFFEAKEYNFLACDSSYCVKIFVHDYESFSWLIDTGASISALKYEYVLKFNIPIINENIIINGIGGKVQAIGYVDLQLWIHNQIIGHRFYVFNSLPCKAHGIIGQDFLSRYRAVIDFNKNVLSLQLNSKNYFVNLYNSEHSMRVPARSESIHYLSTNVTEELVIFTKEISEGIFVASSLVAPTNGRIPIRILNTTTTDVNLSQIKLEIQRLEDFDVCVFDTQIKNAERVKRLFSKLNLSNLNKEEKINIENLCAKYPDVFYLDGDKFTTTDIYQHSIEIKQGTQPIYSKPYRLPHSLKNEIKDQIDNLLKDGVIEPCQSEWSSPILLVPKKSDSNGNKKWRLVIDYRKLNNVIHNDRFPLPNITEILDSLSGCVYYSHLDLHQGYYNVSLHPDSRKYTAFDSGRFQMTRLPQGLKTSPSSFSRMMTMAMTGLTYEKCLVYQDDLICYSRDLQSQLKNLQDIFERLRKVNLKLNPNKCMFLQKELLFLGHVVSSEGVVPDPNKINVVKNYPIPTNTDEIKRFVAFVNYYRKFIPNFAEKAYPLNNLCRKNVQFNWNNECQKSFDLLKQSVISHPVLQYPDFSENNEFILQTDASGYAIGSVLCNGNGKPVAFASRSLNKAESRYPTIEKELLAIVWSVKHFRPYLYGRRFKVQSDHKPLLALFNMRDPSSRLMKFRLILEEYDFVVEYVKGKNNSAADAMSRLRITSEELKEMNECSVNVMTRRQKAKMQQQGLVDSQQDFIVSHDDRLDHPKVVEMIHKPRQFIELRFMRTSDELIRYRNLNEIKYENKVFCYVPSTSTIFINPASRSQLSPREFVRDLEMFCKKCEINEIYFIKNENNYIFIEKVIQEITRIKNWPGPRLCILKDVERIVDKDDQRVILNDFHLLPTSGHAGIRRMINNIKKYYFWPGLEVDVTEFVKRCDKCQKQKHSSHHTREPMVITTTANSAFEKIYLDIVGPLDRDYNNYTYILTIQCELSKYIEAYPLLSKSSEDVAKNFVNKFILRYGIPRTIATDMGSEFLSATMKEVCTLLHIKQLHSTAYHHQSIGALENTHKHLGNYLRIHTENHSDGWSTWLPFWCFSYNTSVHTETKFTPFELVFGKKCTLPTNLNCGKIDPLYNFDNYPLELKYRIQTSQKEARDNLISSKINRKIRYDQNVNSISYKPNDLILIKNETGNKFTSIYSGPYFVVKDCSPNVEIIKDNKNYLVHKNRTKLYIPPFS